MAPRGKQFVIAIALLLLSHQASAIGSWQSARYWSGLGYSGVAVLGQETGWSSDFGIVRGRCNASLVSTFIDDSPNGDRDHSRSVATLRGAIVSDTAGPDAIDRGCMGHALELAPSFFAVRWINPRTHGSYLLTPMRRLTLHGNQCRLFSAQMTLDGESTPLRGTACRHGRGDWYMI